MEFQIVKFPEENDAVAVVAKPWMVGEVCYWPPPPNNVNKLVKNYAEPNFETWVKCKALIVGNAYGKLTCHLPYIPFYIPNYIHNFINH